MEKCLHSNAVDRSHTANGYAFTRLSGQGGGNCALVEDLHHVRGLGVFFIFSIPAEWRGKSENFRILPLVTTTSAQRS